MTLKLKTNRNYSVYEKGCSLLNTPLFTLKFFAILKSRFERNSQTLLQRAERWEGNHRAGRWVGMAWEGNHTIRFHYIRNSTVWVSRSYLQNVEFSIFARRKTTDACLFVILLFFPGGNRFEPVALEHWDMARWNGNWKFQCPWSDPQTGGELAPLKKQGATLKLKTNRSYCVYQGGCPLLHTFILLLIWRWLPTPQNLAL